MAARWIDSAASGMPVTVNAKPRGDLRFPRGADRLRQSADYLGGTFVTLISKNPFLQCDPPPQRRASVLFS
jgi:hypothetical protein